MLLPTRSLSFSIRSLGCLAGVLSAVACSDAKDAETVDSCPSRTPLHGSVSIEPLAGDGVVGVLLKTEFERGGPRTPYAGFEDAFATPETFGDCRLYRLPPPCATTGSAAASAYVDFGTLTVSSASGLSVTTPGTDSSFITVEVAPTASFLPGDSLRFVSAGGTFPAFDVSVVAPSEPLVTSPVTTTTVSASRDLPIVFTATGEGTVFVRLTVAAAPGAATVVGICELLPSAGGGTVSSALLQQLRAGEPAEVQVGIAGIGKAGADLPGARLDVQIPAPARFANDGKKVTTGAVVLPFTK